MHIREISLRLLLILFAALALPTVASAQAKLAYAWANDATAASYTPSASYAFNSTGGLISIQRTSAGAYLVTFVGLGGGGSAGGHVQVTAYGGDERSCKVANWSSSGSDLVASIRCFDGSGNAIDSRYTVKALWNGNPVTRQGYVWANNSAAASYTPDPLYSSNSSGGPITIDRTAVGAYVVTFSKLGKGAGAGGHVQVTAYGGGSNTCKVVNWDSNNSDDFVANVRCFNSAGAQADTQFNLSVSWPNAGALPSGYAWASDATSASYTPSASYSFTSSGGPITAIRSGTGSYTITFAGLGNNGSAGGHVEVTAYGAGANSCKVGSWGSGGADFVVNIRCFNSAGAASDTPYNIHVTW